MERYKVKESLKKISLQGICIKEDLRGLIGNIVDKNSTGWYILDIKHNNQVKTYAFPSTFLEKQ